jgi:DNA polymerase phi
LDLNVTEKDTGLLVEIILGFLSKPSNLQRKLSEQVFGSFAPSVTSDGLKLLLDVLLTPETVSGAEDLFDNDAAEDGDEEDAEDDEDGDDDNEEEDEEEESGDDNDEDVDMRMDDDADEELDAALSAALGTTKQLTNGNDESSDEELMDDDEMMALDDNLAAIFRQRLKPSRAKEVKDTKLQIATFKCKVIDLLEILVKQHNDLCVEMILPLLQVLRLTKSDSVHSKTMNLLRKLAKSKELPETSENLMGILRKIHEDAAKAKNKDGNIHSQLSIYIARIARKQGQEEEVIGVYAETMQKWVKNRKSMVRAGLFADWLNWCQSIRQ